MDINIRIAGEAGQGLQTAGDLLVEAFASIRLHLISTQSYMSRIRGGLNWYDIRISDHELFAPRDDADLLIALSDSALQELRGSMTPEGLIIYDGESEGTLTIHFDDVAKEVAGNAIMGNAVAAGAVFGLLGYDVQHLVDYLGTVFKQKGEEIIEKNAACARKGVELVSSRAGLLKAPPGNNGSDYVADGASAVGLGACTGGVKFVSAYPMSPSTAVLNYMAGMAEQYSVLVEQAEDEVAALNMVCGATYAGVPAMTTTSGGGFSLMVEALSLAGMLELPVLVLLAMRPGPATGLPTRTGQEDLLPALHAGHGEFPRAIFAPGGLTECYDCTRQALQIAHKYQSPVFVLVDQYLVDMHKNIPPLDPAYRPIDLMIDRTAGPDYVRYALTESGVSPRAIPGGEAFVLVDSDEHNEEGHVTEDLSVRVKMVDKRLRKGGGMVAEALPPTSYGAPDAEQLLICWGSTYGACREAVDLLAGRGQSLGLLHFSQVWPLNPEQIRPHLEGRKRLTVVEGNATGQFRSILAMQGLALGAELMARYDGMPFTAREVMRRLGHE